jgi:hypothetical protein
MPIEALLRRPRSAREHSTTNENSRKSRRGGHAIDISGEEILCEPEGESHAPPSVSRIEYVVETAALQATPGRGRGAMGSRIRLTKPPELLVDIGTLPEARFQEEPRVFGALVIQKPTFERDGLDIAA